MKKHTYKNTINACFIGYTVQSVVCNFAPLLYVSWGSEFNISITQLTSFITVTFFTQIIVDLLSVKFVDKIGYKKCLAAAHFSSGLGFVLLGILPYVMSNGYAAIMISVVIYSVGSGLLEVLVSPVVEACPTENKAGVMSLLHSFFCWGTVGVIALSTLFFTAFGRENWRHLAFLWAALAIANGVNFIRVPVIEPQEEHSSKSKALFKNKFFYISILLMICAGAAEVSMSQWASSFAETGLRVSKTVGDLAGPMAFAVLMGLGRIIFGRLSSKIKIEHYLAASAMLCIASYLMAGLAASPVVSLAGCALCGLSVSAMWPGTISLSTVRIKGSVTAMFAFMALAGDLGCTVGPTLIGVMTDRFSCNIKKGLLPGVIFPAIIIISLLIGIKTKRKKA